MAYSILVVDDDGDTRRALSELLRGRGYIVNTAPDGHQALTAVKKSGADLIILDLNMPDMTGLSVLKEVKRRKPDLPVIAMSAYATKEKKLELFQEGARYFLPKPIDVDALLEEISSILKRNEEEDREEVKQ